MGDGGGLQHTGPHKRLQTVGVNRAFGELVQQPGLTTIKQLVGQLTRDLLRWRFHQLLDVRMVLAHLQQPNLVNGRHVFIAMLDDEPVQLVDVVEDG